MADDDQTYPKISAKQWFLIRDRVSQSPRTALTPSTIMALCELQDEKSAKDNIFNPLRKLGLIDDEGTLTDVGHKWRDDEEYSEACAEIVAKLYPGSLAILTDVDGSPDPQKIRSWFKKEGKLGDSAAKQVTATYLMLAAPTLTPSVRPARPATPPNAHGPALASSAAARTIPTSTPPAIRSTTDTKVTAPVALPVTVNLAIHLPDTVDAATIDGVFASIRTHLIGGYADAEEVAPHQVDVLS